MDKFLGEFDEVWVNDNDDIIRVGDLVECISSDKSHGNFDGKSLTIGKFYQIIDIIFTTNGIGIVKVLNNYGNERYYVVEKFRKIN